MLRFGQAEIAFFFHRPGDRFGEIGEATHDVADGAEACERGIAEIPHIRLRRLPPQCILGHRAHVIGVDATLAERFHQRDAIVEHVLRKKVGIGRNGRTQEVAEGEIHWRAIVDGPNADL